MSAGYLYVLINPKMPGIAKVGKTTRDPSDRVAELSAATGVPSPFILAYQQPVPDCDMAEQWVHEELQRRGFRVANNREFFDAPLHEIVATVAMAVGVNSVEAVELPPRGETISQRQLMDELIGLGDKFQAGDDVLVNKKKALGYYSQAASMGSAEACCQAGLILHFGGDGVAPNPEEAIEYYKKAASLGWWQCHEYIASIFQQKGNPAAAANSRQRLFEAANRQLNDVGPAAVNHLVGRIGAAYFHSVVCGVFEHTVDNNLIRPFFEEISGALKKDAADELPNQPWHLRGKYLAALQLLNEEMS